MGNTFQCVRGLERVMSPLLGVSHSSARMERPNARIKVRERSYYSCGDVVALTAALEGHQIRLLEVSHTTRRKIIALIFSRTLGPMRVPGAASIDGVLYGDCRVIFQPRIDARKGEESRVPP